MCFGAYMTNLHNFSKARAVVGNFFAICVNDVSVYSTIPSNLHIFFDLIFVKKNMCALQHDLFSCQTL